MPCMKILTFFKWKMIWEWYDMWWLAEIWQVYLSYCTALISQIQVGNSASYPWEWTHSYSNIKNRWLAIINPYSGLQTVYQFCFLKPHPASPISEQHWPQLCLLFLAFLHQPSSPEHKSAGSTRDPVWDGSLLDQELVEPEELLTDLRQAAYYLK